MLVKYLSFNETLKVIIGCTSKTDYLLLSGPSKIVSQHSQHEGRQNDLNFVRFTDVNLKCGVVVAAHFT